jgi:hypothetical protein
MSIAELNAAGGRRAKAIPWLRLAQAARNGLKDRLSRPPFHDYHQLSSQAAGAQALVG